MTRKDTGTSTLDMTRGSPTRLMLRFMVPLLIGNIFQQFYNVADSVIVGRALGAEALAAVGATGSLCWMIFSLCTGLASGIGVVVSQSFGAGRMEEVRRMIGNTWILLAGASALMGCAGAAGAGKVLLLLATPDDILPAAALYLRIQCAGIFAVALYNGVAAILRGLGDSRTPLVFLIIASVLNIALDLLFVLVFHWGVAGAGIATVLAQLLSGIGSLAAAAARDPLFRPDRGDLRPDKALLLRAISIGVPMAAQSALIALSCVILQGVVNAFGSSVIAAFTATGRIEQLVQQPYQSLSLALATFAGQNLGAGKKERVRDGVRKGFWLMLAFTAVMIPVMQLFGRQIMELFVEEENVIRLGQTALRLTSPFYLPLGIIYVCRGMLNGAGDGFFSLLNGVTECAGRILFPWPLTRVRGIGVFGIWLGTALTWTLVSVVTALRYRSGAWKRMALRGGPGGKNKQISF
ncbi:MAG: MATE family efflux transporter [Lachnospiraceae bacterium]